MTGRVITFPKRCVWVRRADVGGWLVLCGSHGWVHGNFPEAVNDAKEIAAGFGVAVRVAA
jgi:hypothetical protein